MTRIKLVTLTCASVLLPMFAFADTVNVTTKVDFVTPAHSTSSTASYAFTPSAPIVFKVAGKECTWVSSSTGAGAGKGCNYSITLDSAGKLTNAESNGNGCTASGDAMIKACK